MMENEKIVGNHPDGPALETVLSGFEAFITEVTQGIMQASPEGEARILAEGTSASISRQLSKVHGYALETHNRLSSVQKVEFQQFLRVQDGLALAQDGIDTFKKMLKLGGVGKKLLKWLGKWFEEIKKILREIIKFLCSIFGWNYPSWIDPLLVLLNELLNFLLGMFGDTLGLDARSLERELSGMEVDYLNELAALERLQQAQRHRFIREDEA